MRRFALLSPIAFFFACSSTTSATTPPPDGDAGDVDSSVTDDGGADAAPPYCPAGYTQVPFLSDTATTHTFSKADPVLDPGKDYLEVMDTDQGRIVFRFRTQDAPIASNSFVFLTLHHFFDGLAFHRVIDQFMAQSGDPNTLKTNTKIWGSGGPGYSFDVEAKPGVNFDSPGVVGMANGGMPNTTGSQFFITFVPYPTLDQNYTVVGNVTEGLDVLPNIVRGDQKNNGLFTDPTKPTRILDAYVCAK